MGFIRCTSGMVVLAALVAIFSILIFRWQSSCTSDADIFYQKMLAVHARVDPCVPASSVVFIGDSHVQGLAVSAVVPVSVNFGIGHDSTGTLLKRLPLYDSLDRVATVVVQIGVNDILRGESVEPIATRYDQICSILDRQTTVIACSVFPVASNVANGEELNIKIALLNEAIERICVDKKRVKFLNLSALFYEDNGSLASRFAAPDGVHLNTVGYSKWIAMMSETIELADSNNPGQSD